MEMSKEEKRAYYKANVEKIFQDSIPRIQDSTSTIINELLNG